MMPFTKEKTNKNDAITLHPTPRMSAFNLRAVVQLLSKWGPILQVVLVFWSTLGVQEILRPIIIAYENGDENDSIKFWVTFFNLEVGEPLENHQLFQEFIFSLQSNL